MKKKVIFCLTAICLIIIDQIIKLWILSLAKNKNPVIETNFIDIILVYNKGVAFSLGSFLGDSLKWIILILLIITSIILIKSKDFFDKYYLVFGLIIGAGISNVIDRFAQIGVIDYIYWHYGFRFAVFNFADIAINISIAYLLMHHFYINYKKLQSKKM